MREATPAGSARRPRIAYVFTDLPDLAGTFSYVELEEMAKRGFEIEIVCLRTVLADGPGARRLRELFPVHQVGYVAPRALAAMLKLAWRRPLFFWGRTLACVRETASSPRILVKTLGVIPKCCLFAEIFRGGRFDWIQAYWASLPARAAWWISGISGVPYGTWAHAGADIYNREHQTEPALRAVLEKASLVLTCNKTNLEYFARILPPGVSGPMMFHPHGVDVGYFSPEKAAGGGPGGRAAGAPARAAVDAADSTRASARAGGRSGTRILSVGRMSEAKGFDQAVRACRLLADRGLPFHYRIVGGGKGQAALQALVDSLGLQDRVELVGALEQPALLAEYHAADLFVVPSVIGRQGSRDGLPNVLLEAMACGLPAVGSNVAAIPEAIEHGRTGLLVPPAEPPALADAIARLAADEPLRRRLGAEACSLVESRFSRAVCMDSLARIFTTAIGGSDPAGATREGQACASFS